MTSGALPLAGIRVVEVSSFVAAPLGGMTLAQLGAEVIRVDPVGGGADYRRWPLAESGASIYWAGLNKGKRSLAADLRSTAGQELVQRLIAESGPGGAVVLTNISGRGWLSHETLAKLRPDLIHLEVLGRADGGTAVDYTVNAGAGFPLITGPVEHDAPVNNPLPVWDIACGLYAALALTAAIRHRDRTGEGARIRLPLENVALATASNLGFLSEAQVNGTGRQSVGNAIYGQFGRDFATADGARFMVVALTPRHFRDLARVTGTEAAVAALETALGVDFADEGQRYRHQETLTGLFGVWFRERTAAEVDAALAQTSVLWERYRGFAELAADPRVTGNPMFSPLRQPGVGDYLAPGLPMSFAGTHHPPAPAPAVGDDTAALLRERLSMGPDEIAALAAAGTVNATTPE